jgi:hypothetical protein
VAAKRPERDQIPGRSLRGQMVRATMALGAHIKSLSDYMDFITVVLLCAPDRFIPREWKAEDEQLNLDRAFWILRDRFSLVEPRVTDAEALPRIRGLLEASYRAYASGEHASGAHLIQDFREQIASATKPRLVSEPNEQ